jgi:hypothetical protein
VLKLHHIPVPEFNGIVQEKTWFALGADFKSVTFIQNNIDYTV